MGSKEGNTETTVFSLRNNQGGEGRTKKIRLAWYFLSQTTKLITPCQAGVFFLRVFYCVRLLEPRLLAVPSSFQPMSLPTTTVAESVALEPVFTSIQLLAPWELIDFLAFTALEPLAHVYTASKHKVSPMSTTSSASLSSRPVSNTSGSRHRTLSRHLHVHQNIRNKLHWHMLCNDADGMSL